MALSDARILSRLIFPRGMLRTDNSPGVRPPMIRSAQLSTLHGYERLMPTSMRLFYPKGPCLTPIMVLSVGSQLRYR
jgi:hypothetical protein